MTSVACSLQGEMECLNLMVSIISVLEEQSLEHPHFQTHSNLIFDAQKVAPPVPGLQSNQRTLRTTIATWARVSS